MTWRKRRVLYSSDSPGGGIAVYDGEMLRTVNVESVKFRTMLTKYDEPKKRYVNDRKPPNSKKR